MNPLHRRTVVKFLAGAAAYKLGTFPTMASAASSAAPWPTKSVRIVSPYGAGGSNDISARLLSEQLSRRLGEQFVVENKPGAATRIANEMIARATPDGSSFLYAAAPYSTVGALYGKLPYDPAKDLLPIVLAVTAPVFLVVNADLPVRNLAEFIEWGRKKPQGLTFAGTGVGAAPHLVAELFLRQAKLKGLTVQYRGDATAYTELLAGRADATLTALTSALGHVQTGKLRVLAVASEKRSPIHPSTPTFAEQGVPGVLGYGWFGFMAPAGTPASIIERFNTEINLILDDATVKKTLLAQGLQASGGSPKDFAQFIEAETVKWSDIIKSANIKPE